MAEQVHCFRPTKRNLAFIILSFNLSLFIYLAFDFNTHWSSFKTTISASITGNNCTTNILHLNNTYINYCDRKRSRVSAQPCLCYADFDGPSINASSVKCAMTFQAGGRMGNRIGMNATLLVLAKLNGRPALVAPQVAQLLAPHFKISLPVLSQEMYEGIKWNDIGIHDWMESAYTNFSGPFVKLVGYPFSNTFFEGFEEELRREFRLKDELQEKARKVLRNIASNRTTSSVTFIGVHVRRGDYIYYMKEWYHGVLADRNFFIRATAYFRSKYRDAVFVVVSNDMDWCKENIDNDRDDVVYIGNNNESDPITDFALLMNCNHSVITVGTYGFFAALFAGGDTVYLTNFTMPDSKWNTFFRFESAFPARWHPIAADLSPLLAQTTTRTMPTQIASRSTDSPSSTNSRISTVLTNEPISTNSRVSTLLSTKFKN